MDQAKLDSKKNVYFTGTQTATGCKLVLSILGAHLDGDGRRANEFGDDQISQSVPELYIITCVAHLNSF